MVSNVNNQTTSITTQTSLQQKLQDRSVFNNILKRPDFVKSDKPKGYLVKETPMQEFVSVFKDTAKDVKNVGKGLKTGKLSDNELGRLNDLGMKIGGGVIAAMLMGSKQGASKKLMEVVGFGTFFSVMSLWPKVAFDLPTKIRYGFNPHQKYVDSQGTKKPFFLDNQFLPWDLWSKEELGKVGDKLGIDKNDPNREELTKEAMRTIALQSNTLWMLTAGFSTPLLTSLLCNRVEKATEVPVAKASLAASSKKLTNLMSEKAESMVKKELSSNKAFKRQDREFSEIVKSLENGVIPDDLEQQLTDLFNPMRNATNKDVLQGFDRAPKNEVTKLLEVLYPKNANVGVSDEFIKKLVGDCGDDVFNDAKALFTEASKGVEKDADVERYAKALFNGVLNIVRKNPEKYENTTWVDLIEDGFDKLDPEIRKLFATADKPLDKEALKELAQSLNRIYKGEIKPAQAKVNICSGILSDIDNISGVKYNKVLSKLMDACGLKYKDIKKLRNLDINSSEFVNELTAKLQTIASDDDKYKKFVSEIEKISTMFDDVAASAAGGGVESAPGLEGAYQKVESIFGKILENGESVFKKGLLPNESFSLRTNMESVNAMTSRLLSGLELEKRIKDGSLLNDWMEYAKNANGLGVGGDSNSMKKLEACVRDALSISADKPHLDEKQILDSFYEICRKVVWQGTYSDALNKHGINGNGDFYTSIIETVFKETDPNASKLNEWKNFARQCSTEPMSIPFPQLGSMPDSGFVDINQRKNFSKLGASLLVSFKNRVNELYNNKTWMRKFGTLAGVLVGVTFASQLFLGIKRKKDINEAKSDTFEKGSVK